MRAPGCGRVLDERRILLRREAEAEIAEAIAWYEARGRGLGADFLRAFEAALSAIKRHPQAFPVIFKEARRAMLRKFPYSVIFTVSADEIIIVACFHAKRNPKRWRKQI